MPVMKSCPVCGAVTFDDAEVCYGCLHRFGGGASGDVSTDFRCETASCADRTLPLDLSRTLMNATVEILDEGKTLMLRLEDTSLSVGEHP